MNELRISGDSSFGNWYQVDIGRGKKQNKKKMGGLMFQGEKTKKKKKKPRDVLGIVGFRLCYTKNTPNQWIISIMLRSKSYNSILIYFYDNIKKCRSLWVQVLM